MRKKASTGIVIFAALGIGFWLNQTLVTVCYYKGPILKFYALLFVSTLPLIAAIGILMLKEWGRILSILLGLSIMALGIYGNIQRIKLLEGLLVVTILGIFGATICWFFTRPKVKEQFKQK